MMTQGNKDTLVPLPGFPDPSLPSGPKRFHQLILSGPHSGFQADLPIPTPSEMFCRTCFLGKVAPVTITQSLR